MHWNHRNSAKKYIRQRATRERDHPVALVVSQGNGFSMTRFAGVVANTIIGRGAPDGAVLIATD